MIRIVVFLTVLAAVAFGVSWLLDRPGEVTVLWLGRRIETSVFVALGFTLLACVLFTLLWSLFALIFRVPTLMSLARHARKNARGRDALSRGMIAVGAGDLRAARRASNETSRVLPHEPMGLLLRAQVAQMEGDRAGAESAFSAMAAKDSTRLLGLRGLHVEARRRGDADAAHRFAREAHRVAPLPWAGDAIVTHHSLQSEWKDALAVVENNARAKTIDGATASRQRAVLETAIARDDEFVDPDGALRLTRSAVKRAPNLVPAVALAARLMSRRGEFRAASKIVERAWDEGPHPELAAAYLAIRPGDSNADRFARATALARRMPDHPESRMLVAEAALATRDFARAREAMRPLATEDARPTVRQCLMMVDIEETENGETGLVREWLARASRAPRDPTWVAEGVTSPRWQPASPVSGKLDAFRWDTPREELGAPPREPILAPVAVELPRPVMPPVIETPEEETPEEDVVADKVSAAEDLPPLITAERTLADTPAVLLPSVLAIPETSPVVSGGKDLVVTSLDAPTVPVHEEMPGETSSAFPREVERDRANPAAVQAKPVIFPLATSPDDPGPRPRGAPYSGGFHS